MAISRESPGEESQSDASERKRSSNGQNPLQQLRASVDKLAPDDCVYMRTSSLLREDQDPSSPVICRLPFRRRCKLLHITPDRLHARVYVGDAEGWIPVVGKDGLPTISPLNDRAGVRLEEVRAGCTMESISVIPVREGENYYTPLVGELFPGAVFDVLEVGCKFPRRGRIRIGDLQGWITMKTKFGQMLIGAKSNLNVGGYMASVPSAVTHLTFNAGVADPLKVAVKEMLEFARDGNLDGIKLKIAALGDNAPSVNCSDVLGRTMLMYAAAFGRLHVAKFLLGFRILQVNAFDDTQKTALHHAVRSGQHQHGNSRTHPAELARLLIERQAYLEGRDHNGCTALLLAVAAGSVECTRVLLRSKANLNASDFAGNTAVDYAKTLGHTELLSLLEDCGELILTPRRSPRGHAASAGHVDVDQASASTKRQSHEVAHEVAGKRLSVLLNASAGEMLGEVVAEAEAECEVDVNFAEITSKLHLLTRTTLVPRELETAIGEAQRVGLRHGAVAAAVKRLEELRERNKAQQELMVAVEARAVEPLRVAIARAKEQDVEKSELDRAESVLDEEVPKEAARHQLRAAATSGNVQTMQVALSGARRAQVPMGELAPLEELLVLAKSRDAAEAELRKELQAPRPTVSSLKFWLQQARDAGILDRALLRLAEQQLLTEEPRERARDLIAQALESQDCLLEKLRGALGAAEKCGLPEAECREARSVMREEEERQRLLDEIDEVLGEVADVDLGDMELLLRARDRTTDVVQRAKAAGCSEAELARVDQRRRKIHNSIENLKGAIRVYCRIRPLSDKEARQGDKDVCSKLDAMTLKVEGDKTRYYFDAVFTPGTQEEVFDEVRDLVQSALDGYNVTIFAYGQTGAGKTFTMYGTPQNVGTAPRTIEELYRCIEQGSDRFTYTVMGSMIELYRNEMIDLLTARGERHGASDPKLHLRTDKAGNVVIEHLVEEECDDVETLMSLLERGNRRRHVATTAMNAESSRSHLILMIKVVSVNRETQDQMHGKILMVDLAGSERLKRSEVTGDGQKEAIEINKSLTALGDVVASLTKGAKSIPYRNHKLTQVMQDSLGGSAKTLMFVNCSPASSNVEETTMSLKYATRAKHVTNDAKRTLRRVDSHSSALGQERGTAARAAGEAESYLRISKAMAEVGAALQSSAAEAGQASPKKVTVVSPTRGSPSGTPQRTKLAPMR